MIHLSLELIHKNDIKYCIPNKSEDRIDDIHRAPLQQKFNYYMYYQNWFSGKKKVAVVYFSLFLS